MFTQRLWTRGSSTSIPQADTPNGTTNGSWETCSRTVPGLIEESIEGSLKRLKLDYVDIYYLLSIDRVETARHEPYMRAYMYAFGHGQPDKALGTIKG